MYAIICTKENCKEIYIGETKRLLRVRLDNHCGYGNNFIHNAIGTHFNQPGHTLANVQIVTLEQIKKNSDLYRKERKEYFIRKFYTVIQFTFGLQDRRRRESKVPDDRWTWGD